MDDDRRCACWACTKILRRASNCSLLGGGSAPCEQCERLVYDCVMLNDIVKVRKRGMKKEQEGRRTKPSAEIYNQMNTGNVFIECSQGDILHFKTSGIINGRYIRGQYFKFFTSNLDHTHTILHTEGIHPGQYCIDHVTINILLGAILSVIGSESTNVVVSQGQTVHCRVSSRIANGNVYPFPIFQSFNCNRMICITIPPEARAGSYIFDNVTLRVSEYISEDIVSMLADVDVEPIAL